MMSGVLKLDRNRNSNSDNGRNEQRLLDGDLVMQ